MDEKTEKVPESRTSMNFGMNTKGLVQMDITCEYATPGETAVAAREAIDLYKSICVEKGLKLVNEAP